MKGCGDRSTTCLPSHYHTTLSWPVTVYQMSMHTFFTTRWHTVQWYYHLLAYCTVNRYHRQMAYRTVILLPVGVLYSEQISPPDGVMNLYPHQMMYSELISPPDGVHWTYKVITGRWRTVNRYRPWMAYSKLVSTTDGVQWTCKVIRRWRSEQISPPDGEQGTDIIILWHGIMISSPDGLVNW